MSVPSAPVPTSTIVWNSAYIASSSCYTGGTPYCGSFEAGVTLSVNGLPESTTGVSLTGPAYTTSFPATYVGIISVPLVYVGPVTVSGNAYAFYHLIIPDGPMMFPPVTQISYIPGQSYTLTTVTSAGTASITETAPGGFGGGTSSAGTSVTWSYEGNADQVAVYSGGVTYFTTTGDAVSPVLVPPLPYTNPGTAFVESCQKVDNNIPGAAPGSFFYISQTSSSIIW